MALSRCPTCFLGGSHRVGVAPFPFQSDTSRGSAQVARLSGLCFFVDRRKRASCLRDRESSPGPRTQRGAVPVVWVALLFTRE